MSNLLTPCRRLSLGLSLVLPLLAAPALRAHAQSEAEPPYDLGTPPAEVDIRWPTAPAITRTVAVTSLADALTAASTSGTRVHVEGAIAGTIEVRASDVEIEFAPGASADAVWVANRLARVAIRGGLVDHIELQLPAEFREELEFRSELMTTDVLVDGVEADADDTAFLMRAGVRIAIVNSHARAERYGIWFGDSGDFESEDVIVAGNDIESVGPEATVRLVNVVRSATVENRLTNGAKHNYRIHGRSDLNWASRNVLINSGIMLGTMADDVIGSQWFDDNVFYHSTPSLLEVLLDSPSIVMRRNTVHSDVWDCFLCRETPPTWVIEGTQMLPYQPPPS